MAVMLHIEARRLVILEVPVAQCRGFDAFRGAEVEVGMGRVVEGDMTRDEKC